MQAAGYSPDGLTAEAITDLQRDVEHELRRERLREPTSWMSMSDTERHRIRPPRQHPETTVDSQGRPEQDAP
jgi:hypothetical protein